MSRGEVINGGVRGRGRSRQSTLFPALLDDYVAEDNPVRAIDVFVDGLDLGKLGFTRVQPLATGRPGYLNRVPSSRRLERECQRLAAVDSVRADRKRLIDYMHMRGHALREASADGRLIAYNPDFDLACGTAQAH
jgi:hypothetical protein